MKSARQAKHEVPGANIAGQPDAAADKRPTHSNGESDRMRRRRQRCCANVDTARNVTIVGAVREQGSESRDGETNREG